MAFVIDTFSIPDEQDLGGFVMDTEGIGHFIGDGAEADKVEIIEVDGVGRLVALQPAFNQGAGGTAGYCV